MQQRLLKALANDNRLMILCLLFEGPRSVGELNELLPLSQSALSQHLAVLREEGLVKTKRQAQNVLYRDRVAAGAAHHRGVARDLLRIEKVVGARGFEPPTLWSQTRCATRLRHAPTSR